MASTLLCIDDDRAFVSALGASLRGGERLLHCSEPEEALVLVQEEEPDLVLLEIRLAAGNGLDFVERMRGMGGRAGTTPVLVVSASGQTPGIRSRAADLGVVDFLSKPVPARRLAAAVEAQLKKARLRSSDPNEDSSALRGIGSGKLSALPFPELLDRVHRRGQSGVLIVGDARERTGIQIRNGSPVAVTLPRHEELDAFLIRTGRLSEEDRDRVLSQATLGLSSIGDMLIGADLLDEATLATALCEQADEAIFHLFELGRGRYRFEPERRLRGARSLEVARSAQSIIVRGVLAWQPLESIDAALRRYGDLYLAASSNPEPRFDDVPYSDAQRRFVGGLVGDLTVRDFLGASEFERRTLYAFTILGLIELSPEPMLVLDEAVASAPASRSRGSDPEELEEILLDQPDLSYDAPFEGPRSGPAAAASAAPAPEPSHEEELFEERIFEEDSFESEMVSEEAAAEASDPGESNGTLLEIERLVSSEELAAAAPEPPVAVPEARTEAPPKPAAAPSRSSAPAEDRAPRKPERAEAPPAKRPRPVAAAESSSVRPRKAAKPDEAPTPDATKKVASESSGSDATRKKKQKKTRKSRTAAAEVRERADDAKTSSRRDPVPEPARPAAAVREPEPKQETPAPEPIAASAAAETGSPPQPEAEAEKTAGDAQPAAPSKPAASASKSYAIAPLGSLEMNPEERALIAKRVQRRVDQRYGHLVDRGREQADEGAGTAAAADDAAGRALQAETWFRKGRELLKVKKYDQAVEAFGMCSHLDPTEGEYVAHLGYTLYLSKPEDEMVRKEALEDIARGIKLSPDRELPYVYLGRIFKVQGDEDTARKMFRRALKLRPHCREAAQELRLMEMRDKKKGAGLLSRLLK